MDEHQGPEIPAPEVNSRIIHADRTGGHNLDHGPGRIHAGEDIGQVGKAKDQAAYDHSLPYAAKILPVSDAKIVGDHTTEESFLPEADAENVDSAKDDSCRLLPGGLITEQSGFQLVWRCETW